MSNLRSATRLSKLNRSNRAVTSPMAERGSMMGPCNWKCSSQSSRRGWKMPPILRCSHATSPNLFLSTRCSESTHKPDCPPSTHLRAYGSRCDPSDETRMSPVHGADSIRIGMPPAARPVPAASRHYCPARPSLWRARALAMIKMCSGCRKSSSSAVSSAESPLCRCLSIKKLTLS